MVAQQNNVCCHTTKPAQEQPKQCDTEVEVSTLTQIAPVPYLIEKHGTCLKSLNHIVLLALGCLLCLKQCFGGFDWSKNIHKNTMTQGFPLELCTVAMINVINFMCQWLWFVSLQ